MEVGNQEINSLLDNSTIKNLHFVEICGFGLTFCGWLESRSWQEGMKTYEVKILGQRYKIRSDEDEEYIHRLADFVNEQLLEVQRSSRSVATHNVAILAALNIADELIKRKSRDQRLKEEVLQKIRRILKLIRRENQASGRV